MTPLSVALAASTVRVFVTFGITSRFGIFPFYLGLPVWIKKKRKIINISSTANI